MPACEFVSPIDLLRFIHASKKPARGLGAGSFMHH
jgi:hypothetical protein